MSLNLKEPVACSAIARDDKSLPVQIFIIFHYGKMFIIIKMPIRENRILVDFEPCTETNNVVTKKCYRCKQVKDIDGFKRCESTGKHSYCYVKYIATCSECLSNTRVR